MGGHCPVSLLRIIVGDDQLRELAPIVVPLLDVVDAGGFHQKNSRLVVQPPHKSIVVVGQQELSLYGQQRVPQADVVPFREAVLTDVLVIPLCGMVGRVEIEKAHRTVVLADQLFEVLVLNNDLRQPAVGLFN